MGYCSVWLKRLICAVFVCFGIYMMLGYVSPALADEEYMTDSGEIRETSDDEVMNDSGELSEVDEGEYMTDSGEMNEVSDDD